MKFRNSLLFKYLLIVIFALVLLPLALPLMSLSIYILTFGEWNYEPNKYESASRLEQMWHEEARRLAGAADGQVNERMSQLKAKYPEAALFWVDGQGHKRQAWPDNPQLPEQWTAPDTVQFMKQSFGGDPFTVVAFIGEEPDNGFMVFQLPRSLMMAPGERAWEGRDGLLFGSILLILGLFLFISFVFFYKIRRRLLALEQAMADPGADGIPAMVQVTYRDEIGRLEQAFNRMIGQIQDSRRRELEEEQLRRKLIANLSHDLRTPLTTIRGHAYSLKDEPLSEQGRQSIELMDYKIGYLADLIDNLLSYTLLSAGKYPIQPKTVDAVRLLRTTMANWYPLFEQEQFTVELQLPEYPFPCRIDPQWMERVLDNLLQNVLRHARSGRYVEVSMTVHGREAAVHIRDRGPGMTGTSMDKGYGIGLTIVDLMLKEMKLKWKAESGKDGTCLTISGLNQI